MEKHRKTKIKDITNARRYVKSSTMCDTHFLNCRRKKKKKTREVSQVFLHICEYIVETSCSTIFSKNNFILCQSWITSNNAFPFKNAKWCFAVVSVELHIFFKGERKKFLKNHNICSETSFFIIKLVSRGKREFYLFYYNPILNDRVLFK